MLENDTRNQHFLTRVEQKLNAMNPQADARKLRIYTFEVVDRENYTLALESQNGRLIGSNLSLFDLFSFDVPGGSRLRLNFESLFHKYEAHIEAHTKSLLAKLNARNGDIKAEIIDLFAAKLLNFVRNPFSVVKVLNSFPGIATYDPVDPTLLADYRRIVSGRKPHQAYLCAQLGISDAQYVEWLRLLFMLLMPMAEGRPNFFEETIKNLLENRKMHVAAFVCEYDSDRWTGGSASPSRTARIWRSRSTCVPLPSWTTSSPIPQHSCRVRPRRSLSRRRSPLGNASQRNRSM
jgi:hypothetical protein